MKYTVRQKYFGEVSVETKSLEDADVTILIQNVQDFLDGSPEAQAAGVFSEAGKPIVYGKRTQPEAEVKWDVTK